MMFSRLFRRPTRHIELDLTDEQIQQLREILDNTPLHARGRTNPYAMTIVTVLKQLPLSVDCPPSVADARPAQNISESGCGFSLIPFTPKGKAAVAHIERVLGQVEVIDDVCLHGEKVCETCAHMFGKQWLMPHGESL